jgi:divalent metal cation (Fe/Co/Zn/Cd) transporter
MILVSQLIGFIISLAIGMTLVALVSWGVAALTTETIGWVAFGVFVFLCVNKSIIHAVEGYQGRKYESQMRKAS